MNRERSYHTTYKVRTYETDPFHQVKITTLCDYFQETAGLHATLLGLGMDDLAKENKAWVLSHLYLTLDKYPSSGETVTIETWPIGMQRLFTKRDFLVKNAHGEILCRAASFWLLIDLNTRRPLRFSFPNHDAPDPRRHALDVSPEKLEISPSIDPTYHHKIAYSDLDINKHVNNVKYMEWIVNAMMQDTWETLLIKEFHVQFLSEAFPGQEMEIQTGILNENEQTYSVKVMHTADGKEICRARCKLAPRG